MHILKYMLLFADLIYLNLTILHTLFCNLLLFLNNILEIFHNFKFPFIGEGIGKEKPLLCWSVCELVYFLSKAICWIYWKMHILCDLEISLFGISHKEILLLVHKKACSRISFQHCCNRGVAKLEYLVSLFCNN